MVPEGPEDNAPIHPISRCLKHGVKAVIIFLQVAETWPHCFFSKTI